MSYPVDPSELYELRREVEELKAELDTLARVNATLSEMRKSEHCRRKKAEKVAKDYADANARALRVIAMLTDEVAFSDLPEPWPRLAGVGEITRTSGRST